MATPRLGLVVEDKPTELSCTAFGTCNSANNANSYNNIIVLTSYFIIVC